MMRGVILTIFIIIIVIIEEYIKKSLKRLILAC